MKKEDLEKLIRAANAAYYSQGQAIMTDAEYDNLRRQLEEMDADSAALEELGEDHVEGFATVTRTVPMLSLRKVQQDNDGVGQLSAWLEKLPSAFSSYIVSYKMDGCAAEALYQDNKLVHVSTRGNGLQGDDITRNVGHLFPAEINDPLLGSHFAVRGEVCMPIAEFERINQEQAAAGLELYANPRNLCAGTIKSLVPTGRKLDFLVYGFVSLDKRSKLPQLDGVLYRLQSHGFELARGTTVITPNSDMGTHIMADILLKGAQRANEPYCTDGAVVTISNFHMMEELGATAHHPHGAIAWKYPPERKETTVKEIVWQLGAKTGRATPVLEVVPTYLDGSIVSRVSMSNAGRLRVMGVAVGSRVVIHKANDIIPQVVEVLDPAEVVLEPIMACPCCGTSMTLEAGTKADTAHYVCTNTTGCKDQIIARMTRALGTEGLDVLGFGTEICAQIYDHCGVSNPAQLLLLAPEQYPPSLSEHMAVKLHSALQAARTAPLTRWIAAHCFEGVGKTTATKIAQTCDDWVAFALGIFSGKDTELGITPRIRDLIKKDMAAAEVFMQNADLNPKSDCYVSVNTDSFIAGKSFVVTGSFDAGRKNVEELVTKNGGLLKSSVSKKTNYLVVGQDVGATKTKKAADLGTTIITEQEFFALINK